MENAMHVEGGVPAAEERSLGRLQEFAELRREELDGLRTDISNTEHLLPQVKNPDALRGFEKEIEQLKRRAEDASGKLHSVERELPPSS